MSLRHWRHVGPVLRFAEIDSTNRYLADEGRKGAASGLVAVASHQTAGRGRLGRRWEAPAGANLLMSVLFRLDQDPHHKPGQGPRQDLRQDPPSGHAHTIAVALAAADACHKVAGVNPGLKWPNDLVVGDEKLAGVLAEGIPGAVAIGIGLNVNWP
ncbi:MAG: biotin--[acetyl-CoA-carboxylase] ligase, partial [Acidimicrobiales bacterium]